MKPSKLQSNFGKNDREEKLDLEGLEKKLKTFSFYLNNFILEIQNLNDIFVISDFSKNLQLENLIRDLKNLSINFNETLLVNLQNLILLENKENRENFRETGKNFIEQAKIIIDNFKNTLESEKKFTIQNSNTQELKYYLSNLNHLLEDLNFYLIYQLSEIF